LAGLVAGDVVVAVEDMPVVRPLDFQRAMLDRTPGETVRLAVRRAAKSDTQTLSLTLGAAGGNRVAVSKSAWDVLGLELKPISSEEFRKSYQTHYHGGLNVTAVRPNSPAAKQGIVAGDVLVGMHVWETASQENVDYILRRPDFAALSPLKFFILRGNETLYGFLTTAPIKTAQR